MISVSSAFQAANAALAKQPIYLIEIAGYTRAFSTIGGLGTFESLIPDIVLQSGNLSNIGGAFGFPGTVTLPNSTPAGNILYAFMNNEDGGTSPGISDTGGNTWTPICSNVVTASGVGNVSIWRAVSVGTGPGNQITFTTGANRSSSDFFVIEIPAAYSASFFSHSSGSGTPSGTTSDGNTLTVPMNFSGPIIDLFMISVNSGSGVTAATAIGLICSTSFSVKDPEQILSQAGGAAVVGGAKSTGYDWLVSIDDQKLTVSDLDGGADLADLTFTIQDRGQQFTADLSQFVFEGKKARLLHGFVGMTITDFMPMFTGEIDSVDSANGNMEYQFTVSSINLRKLAAKIYLTGDDGFAIDSKHPKTINAHPLDVLVDALEQAGISDTFIDTAKIDYYRDNPYSGAQFVFTLTSAPTAKDFIENEIMKPLAMYLWENNLGQVSINSFYPAVSGAGGYTPPTPPVMTAVVSTTPSDANQMEAPIAQEAPLVNQVIFKFDDDGTGNGNFNAEQIVDLDASIAKYGLVGGQTIESQGMKSGFQGYFLAAFGGRLISLRYGFKSLTFDPLPLTWNACVLEPGDIIAVTNPFVPDRVAGVLGITGQFFEVLDRNWRFMDGVIEVKLLAINFSLFKQYQIAPNAEADYASASTTDKGKYMFQCDSTGHYSTGATANTLG